MISRKLNGIGPQDTMHQLRLFCWGYCKILQLTCHLMNHILITEQFIWAPKARVLSMKHGGGGGAQVITTHLWSDLQR